MIEAWFERENGTKVPCLMPDEQIRELAALADMDYNELFCVDIPAGATREARVKCLVSASQLQNIYQADGPYGNGSYSIRFKWRHLRSSPTDEALPTPHQLWVFPMPPRPLFAMPDSAGVYMVEAVDCRYWWKRATASDWFDPLTTSLRQSDGRQWAARIGNSITDIIAQLPVGSITLPQGFTYPLDAAFRIEEQMFSPTCSLAMMLDLMLSVAGYMVEWNGFASGSPVYTLKAIGNDAVAINDWMLANPVAVAGGFATTSGANVTGSPNTLDPLYVMWQGGTVNANGEARQVNRISGAVGTVYPLHAVEGKTYYSNAGEQVNPPNGEELAFAWYREIMDARSVETYRARSVYGKMILREPKVLPGSPAVSFPTSPPLTGGVVETTVANGGILAATMNANSIFAAVKLAERSEVQFGRVAWGGWQMLPLGSFRATMYRFTIGVRDGDFVPVTLTQADEDDWVLGPTGLLPDDPNDIVMSTGTVHARRLATGVVTIDSAPPMCRVFPAEITGSTQVPGEWRWNYSFVEVASADDDEPLTTSLGNYGRRSAMPNTGKKATNLTEEYNEVGVRIAPGVLQADYPQATIQPLAIANGVIVMMCEQFNTIPTDLVPANNMPVRRYWFAMPNAVRVICTPLVGDYDYGSFAVPAALYDDAGTFDAPTWTFDFGTY